MSQLENALNIPILRYSGKQTEMRPNIFQSVSALFYLLINGRKNGFQNRVKTRVLQHLRNIIVGGREPCVDCQHYWHYPTLAASITLAKNTPEIWEQFSDEEIERFDTLMECFLYITNFIANDQNDYNTGISLRGDVSKRWNPNFKISLISPIIFCSIYFGGSVEVDNMLENFDYDTLLSKLTQFGFRNIIDVWTTPDFKHNGETFPGAKKLLTDGGQAYIKDNGNVFKGGNGVGVKVPFICQNYASDDMGLINYLLKDCYNGGAVFSHTEDDGTGEYDAYIIDGTVSPVEGQLGMFTEFNGKDMDGIRSDAFYCMIDFNMVIAILMTLKELRLWSESLYSHTYSLISVGNTDLVYKLEHGYMSHSLGIQRTIIENDIMGYPMMKEIWETYFKQLED